MAQALRALLVLGLCAGPTLAAAGQVDQQSVAAVEKVIQMLTDMATNGKQEKAKEEIAFAEFSTWCTEESANTKNYIKKGAQRIELLSAEIEKAQEEVTLLGEAIANLQSSVTTMEADSKASTEQRKKDRAAFEEESQDYSESVDALERAIQVLQKQNFDRTGKDGASLLQLVGQDRMPAQAKSLISAFVGMMDGNGAPEGMAYEAPEANAYEFQSDGLISMLKKLRDDFRGKLGDCQKEEMNSKHAYDMIISDLTDSIDNANRDAGEKGAEKDRKSEKAALDTKERGATEAVKKEDEKTLASMTIECREKQMSVDEKQQLRAEEIEAIEKAIEILRTPEVSGNAEKHLASLAQLKAPALVQVSESDQSSNIRRKVREFLEGEGRRLKSQKIALLAQQLAADPFAKVKKLIDGMITRLLEEANSDADHEGFCDTEIGKSRVTRNKLSEDIDAISAAIDDGKATIMTLTQDVAQLQQQVSDIDKSVGEATDLRKKEKATNAATVKDAKAAQSAVSAAMAVLKDFYAKASVATALVQTNASAAINPRMALLGSTKGIRMGTEEWEALANPNFDGTIDKGHKKGMQTFGETYSGQQDEAGGVLGLLEVIQSDFANLQSDTEASEAASQKAFDDFMIESRRSKATKSRSIEMSNADKAAAESKLQEDTADLKSTQDQLLAADRYYERLVPQCIDKGMTYDQKVAARESEITSLKEALKILSSEDIQTSA